MTSNLPILANVSLLLGAFALLALLVAEKRQHFFGRAISKTTASTCFVLLAIAGDALGSRYGQLVLLALLLCWLGDVLLIQLGRGAQFMLGIGAFLLGHVVYALAFWQLPLNTWMMTCMGAVMLVAAVLALRYLRPHLDAEMRAPVMAYVVAISVMTVIAAGAGFWLGLMAVLFAVSDLSVARDRFIKPGFINVVWGLPLYYLSQFGIAASLLR